MGKCWDNTLLPCWPPGQKYIFALLATRAKMYFCPATIYFSSRQLNKRQFPPYSCYATKSKNIYFQNKIAFKWLFLKYFVHILTHRRLLKELLNVTFHFHEEPGKSFFQNGPHNVETLWRFFNVVFS